MRTRFATLVFVVQNGQVLLAEKLSKTGRGRLNGYGGKLELGESPREAVCREFLEETGGATIDGESLEKVALTHFFNQYYDGKCALWIIHVYIARGYSGTIVATEEMAVASWYSIDDLPLEKLLPADPYWLPFALHGKSVFVRGGYGPGLEYLLPDLEVVETQFILDA